MFELKKGLPEDVRAAMHIDLTYLDTETRMQESALQLVYLESHLHDAKVECVNANGWENTYGSRCLKAHVLTEG